ncbi:MAG: sugar phosphate isomerase/epimerase [Hyphomicrobiales bacterium]|nr:MAG: sugar phosphate isomerase/epimerase [Hyphomicrobiales bacterium]
MRPISLSALTVLPCSPLEQIDAAHAAGYDSVGLRLFPVMDTDIDVMAEPRLQQAIRDRLAQTGLNVFDVEVVRLTPGLDVPTLTPALEFASTLGARWLAVTSGAATEYSSGDEDECFRRLEQLCDLTAANGMNVMLEFMVYRPIDTLEHAMRVATSVGHSHLGVTIDALHFFRSGGNPSMLARVDPKRLACVQLCDAPAEPPADLPREARYQRQYPGEGGLPLRELIAAVPADLPVCVEAPSRNYAHLSVEVRAKKGLRLTHKILDSTDRTP